MYGPIQIYMIFRTGSTALCRFARRWFPVENSQHWFEHPTDRDLNMIYIYLCSCCLSSLFSCSNFSRRVGSCLDASMRSSVDHSLLFTLVDEPIKETFPRGWTEFDNVVLRKCAITEPSFHQQMDIGNSWISRMFLFLEARPEVGCFGSLRIWSRNTWITLMIYLVHFIRNRIAWNTANIQNGWLFTRLGNGDKYIQGAL